MSLFKMAIGNIKKCIRDYVVYFFTLILGVAIFYVFNSLGDQSIICEMAESDSEIIKLTLFLLEVISVGVAFVLGFLILYANHFLIRRRKKEFGIYMILGMGKRDISRILISETVLVGTVSLAAGLLVGVFLSQFVSILTGKFFEADMSIYRFTISADAIVKTVVNFAVMYLIVILFHSVIISKYKLVDLLSAQKKTERQLLKNPVISICIFLVAAVILFMAYYRVGFCPNELGRNELIAHIISGTVATILLFWSLSGFLIYFLSKQTKLYYKNLNSFIIRQFCNSINTSAISMAIICLMLFMTICTFGTGFSLAHQMQENIRNLTPVDFSIIYDKPQKVSEVLKNEGLNVEQWAEKGIVEVPVYCLETVTYKASMGTAYQAAREQFPYADFDSMEVVMGLSDYNTLASLYGLKTLSMSNNEYMIVCDFKLFSQIRNEAMADGTMINVGSLALKPAMSECVNGYIYMTGTSVNSGVVIVPDELIDNAGSKLKLTGYVMAGNYAATAKDERKVIDEKLIQVTEKYTEIDYTSKDLLISMILGTKLSIRRSNNGLTMMSAFVVIYVGVVFLVASAALLSLKALSESIDSMGRYTILKKMGSDDGILKKALFAQIGVYFGLPMVVAVIHSVIGLRFAEYAMVTYMKEGVFWGVCVTLVVMVVLYGGYMVATYNGSKQIVKLDE